MNAKDLTLIYNLLINGPTGAIRKLNIWRKLCDSSNITGDVIEVGSFRGESAALIRFLMNSFCPTKALHVYDGFQGLQGRSQIDGDDPLFINGSFCATKDDLIRTFEAFSLELPTIHQSLVQDLTSKDFPESICFAHIDLDLYEPTMQSLKLVWEKLSPGGNLIIDDYGYRPTPGVTNAVQNFFADKDVRISTDMGRAANVQKPLL